MSRHDQLLRQAFPSSLANDLEHLLHSKDFSAAIEPHASTEINVGVEQVKLPQRVYFERDFAGLQLSPLQRIQHFFERDADTAQLPFIQRMLNACLYTRHHNGYQREAALRMLFASNAADIEWVVPFVVQLAAEYVENILLLIDDQLPYLNKAVYRNFLLANPEYYFKTKQRIVSYWDCYYRRKRPRFNDYVGGRITAYFEQLVKSAD
ncbi:hypothetical protein [Herpetosiphon geysericola]|uniref:hypothetical protein n=1 Tax=Herpetosiphon geysericola TaxID=70996 RepID=UPI0006C90151|nr:hypothetical protein [Herpetosiphon geysericola]